MTEERVSDNADIKVLQTDVRHMRTAIDGFTEMWREHCARDEETRTTVALVVREQKSHCKDINGLGQKVHEAKKSQRNPWAIGGVSGITAGGILLGILELLKMMKGAP